MNAKLEVIRMRKDDVIATSCTCKPERDCENPDRNSSTFFTHDLTGIDPDKYYINPQGHCDVHGDLYIVLKKGD